MFDHNSPFVLGVQIDELWKSFGLDDVLLQFERLVTGQLTPLFPNSMRDYNYH